MAIATAAAIAAGVAVAATTAGGVMKSKSEAKAQATNMRNAERQRSEEYQRYLEDRGETGFATLPRYAKTADGMPFEPEMFADTAAVYDATGIMDPKQEIIDINAEVQPMQEMQGQAQAALGDVFSGATTDRRLGYAQPVAQGRLNLADTKKQAWFEALAQTLNEINAIQLGKGYSGDSTASNRLRFDARRGILTDVAATRAGAELANAEDVRGINDAGEVMKLNNLQAPLSMALQTGKLRYLPQDMVTEQQAKRVGAVKQGFNIGTGNFQYRTQLPMVQPIASVGENIAGGIAAGAGVLGGMPSKPKTGFNSIGVPEVQRVGSEGGLNYNRYGNNFYYENPNATSAQSMNPWD